MRLYSEAWVFILVFLSFSAFADSKRLMGSLVCSGDIGEFEVTVQPSQKVEVFNVSIKPLLLKAKNLKVNVLPLKQNGDYSIHATPEMVISKIVTLQIKKEDFEEKGYLILQNAEDKDNDWLSSGRNSARCYPKSVKNAVVPNYLEKKTAFQFEMTFKEVGFTSWCDGSIVNKKKQGKECKYVLLTAAHCLHQTFDEDGERIDHVGAILSGTQAKKALASEFYFPKMNARVKNAEISIHPKFRQGANSNHDVGLATFTAPCVSDEIVPVYEVSDKEVAQDSACAVIGPEGPLLVTVNREFNSKNNFGIDWSMHTDQNRGLETPKGGWSGSALVQGRSVVGCFYSSSVDENVPYGMCASGECMTWVKRNLQPEIKLR